MSSPPSLTNFKSTTLPYTYDDILDERVMLTIRDDLPTLDAALARIVETK